MSDYTPKKGDRVRVVLEGEVGFVNGYSFGVEHPNTATSTVRTDSVVSIEKIEPPVEQFKVGDIVRDKRQGHVLALGPRGYMYVGSGHHYGYGVNPLTEFTSQHYEKINLADAR